MLHLIPAFGARDVNWEKTMRYLWCECFGRNSTRPYQLAKPPRLRLVLCLCDRAGRSFNSSFLVSLPDVAFSSHLSGVSGLFRSALILHVFSGVSKGLSLILVFFFSSRNSKSSPQANFLVEKVLYLCVCFTLLPNAKCPSFCLHSVIIGIAQQISNLI